MEVLLTERLICPRCGPPFGLILLAQRVEDRRVLEGSLGCPNCRDRFPVVDGFGDLRPPPRDDLTPAPDRRVEPDRSETLRLAALLGITAGPGRVVLIGRVADHAPGLAAMISELEVIAIGSTRLPGPEVPGVSRIAATDPLPFQTNALQGAGLSGEAGARLFEEVARSVAPGGRIVVLDALPRTREEAAAAGLAVLLEQEGVLVAASPGPRVPGRGVKLPVVKGG